jgi:hypothetical protein
MFSSTSLPSDTIAHHSFRYGSKGSSLFCAGTLRGRQPLGVPRYLPMVCSRRMSATDLPNAQFLPSYHLSRAAVISSHVGCVHEEKGDFSSGGIGSVGSHSSTEKLVSPSSISGDPSCELPAARGSLRTRLLHGSAGAFTGWGVVIARRRPEQASKELRVTVRGGTYARSQGY